MAEWYRKEVKDLYAEFKTGDQGLSREEAKTRLAERGPNALPEVKAESPIFVFFRQFRSPLIYVLLSAGVVLTALGNLTDAVVIFAVLALNAVVGTVQEAKAEHTLLSLKKFSEASATVTRAGKDMIVSERELVPGDIVLLHEGEKVSADARLVSATDLRISEASLTGESEPVKKDAKDIPQERLAIADQKNMIWKGTYVFAGNGKALVVATGTDTELGKIAKEIVSLGNVEVPLQKGIKSLARTIIILSLVLSAFVLSLGVARGEDLGYMFFTVVALSVSVIPEGLPVAVTLVLAMGVWRMSRKHVLVKNMQSVETLGHTNILAVDKTGTVTRNEMVAELLFADGKLFEISGTGYEPKGDIFLKKKPVIPADVPELVLAAKISAYTSGARLTFIADANEWKISGDPTEAAMRVFGEKVGFRTETLEEEAPKTVELAFDYKSKTHVVVREFQGKKFLAFAGAPEAVLGRASLVWNDGKEGKFTADLKRSAEEAFERFARRGFRVVALAYSDGETKNLQEPERLVFLGFLMIRDALRTEVKETVRIVEEAGIRVVMITGDHRLTAEAIGKEAGILKKGEKVMTGEELEDLSDVELENSLEGVSVFARVTPEHKLRIIQGYRRRGKVIAMTGDGVNDAPSLVAADLGVALGKIGTDVAKEASDIVLLDDNFRNIASAAAEGRNIYQTVRKVIVYLFSTTLGEVMTIVGALAIGFPLPLLPTQIIWLNFVTDGFFTVALALEPKEGKLLREGRATESRKLVDPSMAWRSLMMGIIMCIGTLYVFSFYSSAQMGKALTMSLSVLAVFQWVNAWNCRSERASVFGKGVAGNNFMILATSAVVILQLSAVYLPTFQKFLHTVPLSAVDWLFVIVVTFVLLIAEEGRKFAVRARKPVFPKAPAVVE